MTIDFLMINLVCLYLLRKHKQRFVSVNTYLHNTNKKHFLSFKSILSMSMSDMVSGQLPLKKIAFQMLCRLHNAPWTNGPEKNCPQENSPKNNLHPKYFSPRIRNLLTSIDSCFLLFSFFVV